MNDTLLFGKGKSKGWPLGQGQLPIRSFIELEGQVAYQSIWALIASIMVPFRTLYLNLLGIYWRKTLMTQKNPGVVICNVTQ